jgi:hypothetical protein
MGVVSRAYTRFSGSGPEYRIKPCWGAALRSAKEMVVAVQYGPQIEVWSFPFDAKRKKIAAIFEVSPTPFDVVVTKDIVFLLNGDGRIRAIHEDHLEDVGDLAKLVNWRKDATTPCFYILDRDNDFVHFLWGNGGYAILDGKNLRQGSVPELLAKLYDSLSPIVSPKESHDQK